MNRLLQHFLNSILLILLTAFGLINPAFAAPVCSNVSVDQMYDQLQQGMTLGQVNTLFGASGYESGQSASSVTYAFAGKSTASSDPTGSGRATIVFAYFPNTSASALIYYKSSSYWGAGVGTTSTPLAAYQGINGTSTLAQVQGLLGASGTEISNVFTGSTIAGSFGQNWRFSDGYISARFLSATQGITSKSLSRSSANVATLSATQVNQIAVGMTLAQVESILGGQAYSLSVNYGSGGAISSQYAYWTDGSGGSVYVYFDANGAVSSKPSLIVSVSVPSWQVADVQAAYQAVRPGMSYAEVTAALASTVTLPVTAPSSTIYLRGTGGSVYLYFSVSAVSGSTNTALSSKSLSISVDCSAPVVAVTPSSLSFTTPATLQSGGRVPLSATASYSNNTSKAVTPTWSSSNSAAATVSSTGILSAGSVSVDTPVTLTATYSENGATVSASRTLTITALPASLASLALSGSNAVQSGGQMLLKAVATYADGSTRVVIPASWTLSNPALGTVNSRGVLAVGAVTSDTPLTVTGSYTEGALTKSASLTLNITATPATLSALTLIGTHGTMAASETLSLAAEGVYSDGSRKPLSATWSVTNTSVASISSTGVLTANPVTQDTPVLVSASTTQNGVTVTAQYQIVIQRTTVQVPVQVEVEATGTNTAYSLKLWFNTNVQATFAASHRYNVYIAALVPGGALVTIPTFFLLNRNSEWQLLTFPLAEYLSGVEDNNWQLIELLDRLDVSMLSGTQIYVGYGTSDQEMLDANRYRLAYQLP